MRPRRLLCAPSIAFAVVGWQPTDSERNVAQNMSAPRPAVWTEVKEGGKLSQGDPATHYIYI
eukprot:SAG31_NODE_28836_length_404_cov_1.334426_1_plen_61_part_10